MDWAKVDTDLRQKTRQAIFLSRCRWRERQEAEARPGKRVTFLGTGGNPEAVISQIPHTAGFVLEVDGFSMYVDPGPGAVVRAWEAGIDLGALDAVYVSHGHLDHYAGAEAVIEAMCWAMSTQRGHLLAPGQVLDEDQLISKFHQGHTGPSGYRGGPRVAVLHSYEPWRCKGAILTPIPAHHGGENYGFVLQSGSFRLGYTSDTNYIMTYLDTGGQVRQVQMMPIMDLQEIRSYRRDIKKAFAGVDVLIANVTTHNCWSPRHITSLGLPHLLKNSGIKVCLLTHFNHVCLQPEDLRPAMAAYITGMSGVPAVVAHDGESFDLEALLAAGTKK